MTRPVAQTGHIGLRGGLIDKDKPFGFQRRQFLGPLLAQLADILTLSLAGA